MIHSTCWNSNKSMQHTSDVSASTACTGGMDFLLCHYWAVKALASHGEDGQRCEEPQVKAEEENNGNKRSR